MPPHVLLDRKAMTCIMIVIQKNDKKMEQGEKPQVVKRVSFNNKPRVVRLHSYNINPDSDAECISKRGVQLVLLDRILHKAAVPADDSGDAFLKREAATALSINDNFQPMFVLIEYNHKCPLVYKNSSKNHLFFATYKVLYFRQGGGYCSYPRRGHQGGMYPFYSYFYQRELYKIYPRRWCPSHYYSSCSIK